MADAVIRYLPIFRRGEAYISGDLYRTLDELHENAFHKGRMPVSVMRLEIVDQEKALAERYTSVLRDREDMPPTPSARDILDAMARTNARIYEMQRMCDHLKDFQKTWTFNAVRAHGNPNARLFPASSVNTRGDDGQ